MISAFLFEFSCLACRVMHRSSITWNISMQASRLQSRLFKAESECTLPMGSSTQNASGNLTHSYNFPKERALNTRAQTSSFASKAVTWHADGRALSCLWLKSLCAIRSMDGCISLVSKIITHTPNSSFYASVAVLGAMTVANWWQLSSVSIFRVNYSWYENVRSVIEILVLSRYRSSDGYCLALSWVYAEFLCRLRV